MTQRSSVDRLTGLLGTEVPAASLTPWTGEPGHPLPGTPPPPGSPRRGLPAADRLAITGGGNGLEAGMDGDGQPLPLVLPEGAGVVWQGDLNVANSRAAEETDPTRFFIGSSRTWN